MIARPLSAANARAIACRSGVQRAIVHKALTLHVETGRPVAVYQNYDLLNAPGMPPQATAAVIFCHGHAEEHNDGWAGMICFPVTDQKELNEARDALVRMLASLRQAIACEWTHL